MPESLFKPKIFESLDQAQAMANEVENTLSEFMSDDWCRKRLTNVEFPGMLDMWSFMSGNEHHFRRSGLYVVSNHYGTMESGHYTAYCLNAPNRGWYKFDDQDVTRLADAVLKSSAAYIAIYQYISD